MKAAALSLGLLMMAPVERPPVEYQGTAPVTVQVTFGDLEFVDAECRKRVGRDPSPGMAFIGCGGHGRMVLPNGCLFADNFAGLVCHELGHVRKWDHG